jgi:hypothetical protein
MFLLILDRALIAANISEAVVTVVIVAAQVAITPNWLY